MAATKPPKSDVEKAATTARESGCDDKEAEENQTSSQGDQDELLVDWDGPDDPQNPLNWSMFWKWAVALLTSFGGLVTLMSGAMLAPALDSIGKDLNTSPDTTNMCLSIFVLAFAFGPMVLAPMTEIFGRRHVWIVCSAWPVWMLVTQPIIQLVSLFLAYNFGTLYFVLTSFASIWITQYHQSVSASGLHYIALVIGSTIGAQLGAALTDRLWAYLKKRAGGETAPEYRIPLMIPGSIVIPISLFWFGWTAETMQKWIVVDIAAAVFNFGIIMSTHSQQQYVMEAYRGYMASATAASQFLRSIFAFVFPLFAPALFARLGYGWGHSVLAFVFLGLGLPSPFILWKFGAKLRAKGLSCGRNLRHKNLMERSSETRPLCEEHLRSFPAPPAPLGPPTKKVPIYKTVFGKIESKRIGRYKSGEIGFLHIAV
ncbi:MFS multidrug transporter [Histoplasma capsulatum var. duboisii H88]|uniref:MFS multidrug transporter n=1 Tax=Ajellomyces capsulatus (strain H88) TaxID=544711 RepID=F0UJ23_AJEC8|nr:MFS multidrug transporter [Histoplasma capsulatum var. duboisii H88]